MQSSGEDIEVNFDHAVSIDRNLSVDLLQFPLDSPETRLCLGALVYFSKAHRTLSDFSEAGIRAVKVKRAEMTTVVGEA